MRDILASLCGAIVFYTVIPLPPCLPVSLKKIALWLGWLGILLGLLVSLAEIICSWLGFSPLLASIFSVAWWLYLTGGFHFDGLIDFGDCLGVQGGVRKRLEVMRDSRVGAFGLLLGFFILFVKIVALRELYVPVWWGLCQSLSWGRWAQLMAITLYPYIREGGKGAFLKEGIESWWDVVLGSSFVLPILAVELWYFRHSLWEALLKMGICLTISLVIAWLCQKPLGGHTGDTYGATVEITEALILSFFTLAQPFLSSWWG